ncbi:tubulin glycylase 3B-like [Cydia splendana]|uniref:tubulin glycylase 3B-like n=1 Tax=Cydia splendana TaxID=1100963 RepID=UPI00300DB142
MPSRKKKILLKKQQLIPNLTIGTSRRLPASTSRKMPTIISVPTTKVYSRVPQTKIKLSPTLMKQGVYSYVPDRLSHKPKMRLGPYEGEYKCRGLSPKERMQIIGNCQKRTTRYMHLKNLAADAIRKNKIFSVYGTCKTVRTALAERGWVEKLPSQRMNMKNIYSGRTPKHEIRNELETLLLSHLVEKYPPSFIWRTKEYQTQKGSTIDMTKDYLPTVNRLQIDAAWTTKQGLCSAIKRNYWFYIEGVAEVYCPRTYNSCDNSEIDSFKNDFKVTACTSLLKWVLSKVANDRPVFVSNGTVSIKIILFAINRCKEYLYMKQNVDIDKTVSNVTAGQWKTFMKNYSRIISKTAYFDTDKNKQLSLYLSYAKFMLKEIYKYRPQLSCEGCHNIWIIKPAHWCRGRGIRLASSLEDVDDILNKTKAKYVLQKYIEEPLLIHETKFDIRQYYLITSTCPLVIWMYKDCYLKFSTQKYNLKNYHESIHLTNNAVQKKYTNCENRHEDLPLTNMWDSDTFKLYLQKYGKEKVWDNIIYPGMKKAIRSIVLGCQDSLVPCKNRFELYGCDFMLDKEYKPWLIEINSCPDLHPTTPVTAKICPAAIRDIIKVVIDYANDPKSSTGKFECIYRQPHTILRYSGGDLIVRGYSLPSSYFYKGKYKSKEPRYDLSVSKQLDIARVMKTMKNKYEKEAQLDCEEDEKLVEHLEIPDFDNQCSNSEVKIPPPFIANHLTGIIERVVSNINVRTSEESENLTGIIKTVVSNKNVPTSSEESSDSSAGIIETVVSKSKKKYMNVRTSEESDNLTDIIETVLSNKNVPTTSEESSDSLAGIIEALVSKNKNKININVCTSERSENLTGIIETGVSIKNVPTTSEESDNLTGIIETVVSNIIVRTSEKSSKSTNKELVKPGGSFSDKNWVDLRHLKNVLLTVLSPSTEKINSKPTNNCSEQQDDTVQTLINMLYFLTRKEKEENKLTRQKYKFF